jgi:hypothetical protein
MEQLLLGRKAVVLIGFLFHDTGPSGEKEPASLEVKMVVVQM